jgi:hypothetical protein
MQNSGLALPQYKLSALDVGVELVSPNEVGRSLGATAEGIGDVG